MKIVTFLLIYLFSMFAMATPIKKIRFATEATYPPFEYLNAEKKMAGFDIDVATALCKKIKAECQFVNQPFNSLSSELAENKVDAIIGAISVTGERKENFLFTDPYYVPSARFISKAHLNNQSIIGKRIGVQQDTTFEKYVHTTYRDKVQTMPFASIQEALSALSEGKVDLVLGDAPMLADWLHQSPQAGKYEFVAAPIQNKHFFGEGYGIALKENNRALLTALNQALADIKKDGTYQKITAEHFSQG